MLHFFKPNPGTALFGVRVLFAFFASPFVFAHDTHHQPTEQAVVATVVGQQVSLAAART